MISCDLTSPDATCPRCGFVSKIRGAIRRCRRPVPRHCGPGCQLKRLLSWFGLRDDGGCGCSEHARQMDDWGPDGCERELPTILGWLREAAARRGLPFVDAVGTVFVGLAIDAARREAHGKAAEAAPEAQAGAAHLGPTH